MKDAEKQSADIVAHAKTEAEGAAVNARDEIENLVARRIQTATDRIARAEADAVRAVRNTAVDAAVEAVSAVMKSSADTAQANNAGAISAIVQGLAR
jgi:F-type H+-transporting ATPase subunit b